MTKVPLRSVHHPHRSAIWMMVLGTACTATQDSVTKVLMQFLPAIVILWVRYALQTTLSGGALLRRGKWGFRTTQPGLHLLRGLVIMGTGTSGFMALQRLPVAEFTAIYGLAPITIAAVGHFFQGDRAKRSTWWALVLGLLGVLLIVRPGGKIDPIGAALALAGVACYTAMQVLTRKLAQKDAPQTIQFYSSLLGLLVFGLLVPWFWPSNWSASVVLLLAAAAVMGTSGQYLMLLSFAKAPASAVSPYLYCAVAFSALWGWALFDHWPDQLALVGIALIVLGGWRSARG
jgi:drug/metabolite transporter (DMT)-like permease